jgi:hypothetical protein
MRVLGALGATQPRLQEKREAAPAFRPGDVVTQEHLMKALYVRRAVAIPLSD